MTALDALLGDELITGKEMREHTSGERRLAMLAAIQITQQGRQLLKPGMLEPTPVSVVHGDQFINYGNLGAAGRSSSGTVTIAFAPQFKDEALSALDVLLSALRAEAHQTPDMERAQREFHKVRDEIVDEPEPTPSTLAKWLTRGKQLLATAVLTHEVIDAAQKVYSLFGI